MIANRWRTPAVKGKSFTNPYADCTEFVLADIHPVERLGLIVSKLCCCIQKSLPQMRCCGKPSTTGMSVLCVLMVCASVLSPRTVTAKDFRIDPTTDFKSIVKQVAAGDSLVLENGVWNDVELAFDQLPGTLESVIQIRAESPGQVVLTGKTQLRFSGQHVVVSGLVFRDNNVSDVVQLRSHSQRHAHHCRVTDCSFVQAEDSDDGRESRWLNVYGTHNRVDHCYFAGKKSRGTTLVVWVSDVAGDHRIDHNHFGPRPELGRNGGETIRIGTSDVSELVCRTVVEDNYFHQCNGEAEIVSNKSCENIYRRNVFDECRGALTLRHGHRCIVEENLFLGKKSGGTGGVRIIGEGHTVINNYFEGLRGDAERAALSMMNGIPDSPLHEYAPVRDATVAHNTFIDCKVSMEFGVGAGKTQSVAPADCRIINNAFLPDKWPLFRVQAKPENFVWDGNRVQQGRANEDQLVKITECDLTLKRASDGLMRPTLSDVVRIDSVSIVDRDIDGNSRGKNPAVGCDEPGQISRTWPNALNTGPDAKR
tara:strand:- start:44449 stop:46059 length:1611 start_codon:yes stop_codon:yes gene_type:complete